MSSAGLYVGFIFDVSYNYTLTFDVQGWEQERTGLCTDDEEHGRQKSLLEAGGGDDQCYR